MALVDLDHPPHWWALEPIQRLTAEERWRGGDGLFEVVPSISTAGLIQMLVSHDGNTWRCEKGQQTETGCCHYI